MALYRKCETTEKKKKEKENKSIEKKESISLLKRYVSA